MAGVPLSDFLMQLEDYYTYNTRCCYVLLSQQCWI
ncbi:hypothetical protein Anas_09749 [Armadillidium nasatum]|uniref:Uncharacterized protein n=1 Tax=Armadillidium nasatum TaxID=96803 RepID=A0A5N5THR4_9CRUS|nr:hypothetical protein Anas_09749 [Armadillidium nasatum]